MKPLSHFVKACAFLPVFALSAFAAQPQGPHTLPAPDVPDKLDLQTAIQYALENNFSIRQAKERIREQEGLIIVVKAQALPNASVDSFYNKNANELSSDRGSNSSTQNWQIALDVRQALYTGGGIRSALDAQAAVREAAILDLEGTIDAALYEVRTRFYNVLLAREQIKVQESNIQLLTEQLQIARNRFQAGASSNFEVLRAEVALANAQPALISARNNYRTAIDQLRQSLGFVSAGANNVTKVPEFIGTLDFTPVSYELEPSIETALNSRPELKRLQRLEDARKAGVRNAQSGYYPNLYFTGSYEYRKSALSNRFSQSLDGWIVGLQSSWAVFDGRATTGRVVQAKSQLRQAQLQTSQTSLDVEVQVRSAISSLQQAAELTAAASKVVQQAEEAVRLADARYAAGTITQLDVLQSRNDLTQARLNQLQANYSYNVAVATIRRATGQADPYLVKQ